jgi:cytochrome c oxidase subunit 4
MSETGITAEGAHGHHGHEHHGHHGHAHHGPNVGAYMAVFGALVVCTLVSFVANIGVRNEVLSPFSSFAIIFLVACIKATLVAVFFMHLQFDWKKVYMMIIPALILGPLLMLVLLPDIVLAWRATAGQ